MPSPRSQVVDLAPRLYAADTKEHEQWRAAFQGALGARSDSPDTKKRLADELQRGIDARAWTLFKDSRGKAFTEFNGFCRHPQPQGLGCEPEDVRHLLVELFGQRRAKLLTVAASRQGQRTSPDGAEKSRNDERLRAILRAPTVVQDLVVAGLVTEKEGQLFGRVTQPPETRKEIAKFVKKAPAWLDQLEKEPSAKTALRGAVKQAVAEVFGKAQGQSTIYSAQIGWNAEVFPSVLSLHVPVGSRVIDVTYGKGVFWKHVPPGTYQVTRCDIQSGTDLRRLPYGDATFDALVLDPPYSSKSKTLSAIAADQEHRYQNLARGTAGHQAILDLYLAGAKEAHRVLTETGTLIVKVQGEVTDGKQYLTHYEIYEAYGKLGFHLDDEFIVIQKGKLPNSSNLRTQYHARKNHSLFLVFRKSRRRPRISALSWEATLRKR